VSDVCNYVISVVRLNVIFDIRLALIYTASYGHHLLSGRASVGDM
jgi:hypothetical protein